MVNITALPSTMKAQFLNAFNELYEYRSMPLPEVTQPNDVLIKVEAASYCHTDAVLAAGKMRPNPPSFPHIGCHEFAGTVVALSPNADPAISLQVGSRVGVPGRSFRPCTTCFECASGPSPESPDADPPGYSVYCPESTNLGLNGPGGFSEYAVVDARQVAPIPDSMSAVETSVLMCAGLTIYAALKRCGLQKGQRVGIMGCGGGLGHLGLQFAVAMGFKVLGVDNADGPLSLARQSTREARIVDAREEEADDVVKQLGEEDGRVDRGYMGLDAVIILPESQAAFTYGIKLLRNHGTCVVVSFPELPVQIAAQDLVFRDVSVTGSLVGSKKLLREMLHFAAQHEIRAKVQTYPLSRLNDLVEEYHKGSGGKLVIDMALTDNP
ncbi:alcohol dehydrogenase-like protein [Sarocladium strictum]